MRLNYQFPIRLEPFVFWFLTFHLAVSALAASEPQRGPQEPRRAHPQEAFLDLSAACPGDRWIGELYEQRQVEQQAKRSKRGEASLCPAGWEPLFGVGAPPGLQRFCSYPARRHAKSLPRDPRPALRGFADGRLTYEPRTRGGRFHSFKSIRPDCHVVGSAGESFFPRYFWPLRERFNQEAKGNDAQISTARTRLVLIDTGKDSETPERDLCTPRRAGSFECSPHGFALANLALDLLCDPSRQSCEADVAARRALGRTYRIQAAGLPASRRALSSTEDGSGLYGSWTDLAQAIRREVDSWWRNPRRPRLVLNLSLGWEGIYGENVEEVRAAIEDAVCRGVLVVAAAGNRHAGPESLEKPLLPAAWERLPAPSGERCRELIGEEPPDIVFVSKSTNRPLVFAVGGVQQDGRLLSNARPGATPRLVAFGDHAPAVSRPLPLALASRPSLANVASLAAPELTEPLITLTGTSVSTVVVSAAAAVRWNDSPELSPFDVMEQIWQASQPVDAPVDFCLDSGQGCPDRARRVYVRPPAPTLAPKDPWPTSRPPIKSSLPDFNASIKQRDFSRLLIQPGCDPGLLAVASTSSAALAGSVLCPQRSRFDIAAQPWLGPQPGSNHNPSCTLSQGSGPKALVLEFDPCFRIQGMPVRLDDLTLVAGDKAFRLPETFKLGDPEITCPSNPRDAREARTQIVLSDPPFDNPYPLYLAATVNGIFATITPLLHVDYDDPPTP